MKEIRLYFYKSLRKNAKCKIKSYMIFDGKDNTDKIVTKYKKTSHFYDAINRISNTEYKYISIAVTNYSQGKFFNSNDMLKNNLLDIPESKRYNSTNKNDLIELVKLVYHYMILLNADFNYNYNPFTDNNVMHHIGNLAK